MSKNKQTTRYYGDEAPTLKHLLFVLVAVGILIALSWLAYYKLHLFH